MSRSNPDKFDQLAAAGLSSAEYNGTGDATPGEGIRVQGTLTTTPSGTQNVNLTQVNGGAANTGNGTAAGSPRVVIASDQTAFIVNAAQSGVWTVQPGATANAIANSWRVQVTDLTNTMPTMDAAARAGFIKLTDTGGANVASVTAAGSLKVAQDTPSVATGLNNISAAANGTAYAANQYCSSAGFRVTVTANGATTITAGDLSFQGALESSSQNWFGIQCQRTPPGNSAVPDASKSGYTLATADLGTTFYFAYNGGCIRSLRANLNASITGAGGTPTITVSYVSGI